jgi:hypothetical protein
MYLDIPFLASKSREIGEMQDMYRRTLAASWACQAGDLPADECIENIFAGGDGWGDKKAMGKASLSQEKQQDVGDEDSGWLSDIESGRKIQNHQRRPRAGTMKMRPGSQGHARGMGSHGSAEDVRSRGVQRRDGLSGTGEGRGYSGSYKLPHEVDELDAREDLRCWSLPTSG